MNRRTVAVAIAGLGLIAVGVPRHAASQQAPPPAAVAGWVTTDLRVPMLDQVRLAAAKRATFCQATRASKIGQGVTMTVALIANVSNVPAEMATELACSFDAPKGTSCDQIKTCEGIGAQPPGPATCDGPLLRLTTVRKQRSRVVACHAFGADCYQTESEGLCGVGACDPGFTYSCEGTKMLDSCMQGVLVKTPCGAYRDCSADKQTGLLGCWPSGPTCTKGPGFCDGPTAVNCDVSGIGEPRQLRIPCGNWGLQCNVTSVVPKGNDPVAECSIPPPEKSECDPFHDSATCVAGKLRICVAGKFFSATCSDLGSLGQCTPGAGFQGEAGCR